MLTLKKYFQLFAFLMFSAISALMVFGASDDVDLTFNAHAGIQTFNFANETPPNIIVQSDGKPVLYGNFRLINGSAVNRVVRLNLDGSLDTSFNCTICNNVFNLTMAVQSDGKFIVAGDNGSTQSFLYRIQADGSLDGSFTKQLTEFGNVSYRAAVYTVQTDGKIFIGHFSNFGSQGSVWLTRLNSNGSVDAGFTAIGVNTRLQGGFINGIKQVSDGKYYVYGGSGIGYFRRINTDGSADATFETPAFSGQSIPQVTNVSRLAVQNDGKVLAVGNFTTVNGLSKRNLVRINTNGSVDLTFGNPEAYYAGPLVQYSNGSLLVNVRIDVPSGEHRPTRLNANGQTETPWSLPSQFSFIGNFEAANNDQFYMYGGLNENGRTRGKLFRVNSDGSFDQSFSAELANAGGVKGLTLQSDGKTVLVGDFNVLNGIERQKIGRLNTDGSVDSGFSVGTGFDVAPRDVVTDQNGKLLVFGDFTQYAGTARSRLVRLNNDGTLDTGFAPTIDDSIITLVAQPDGKILIGGFFNTVNGQSVKRIARLNTDGSFDNTFAPVFGTVSIVQSIFVQTDGKIMIGGSFSGVGGFNRSNLTRLNNDGSFDQSFNAGTIGQVQFVAQTPSGKYMTALNDQLRKLNNDGTGDTSFVSPALQFFGSEPNNLKFIVLPNEALFVYGNFYRVANKSRRGFAALFPNGQLSVLDYSNGANQGLNDAQQQPDGKIILGGSFDIIEDLPRAGIARVFAPDFRRAVNFDFDGDGRADVAVFRPSENKWYILKSSDAQVLQPIFALSGDMPAPADFDGDGKTDLAIFRPSSGDWWSLSSSSNQQVFIDLGAAGDIPLPSDISGDGRADYVLYRPSNFVWDRIVSTGGFSQITFGLSGDKPLIGDIDGDGKTEPLIYRPSTGDWWWQSSIDNVHRAYRFGISTDIPVPADYDGDGKTDFAVYRPSEGVWYIRNSETGTYTIVRWGISEDKPVPADFDGDGKADIAVYRPSTGTWYLLKSTEGFAALRFGIATDIPVQNAFLQ